MMSLIVLFGVTLGFFLTVIALMAIGVLLGRRAISGSCGGLGGSQGEPGEASCSLCSNPEAACRDLARRMKGPVGSTVGSVASKSCELDCQSEGCTEEEIAACNRD